MRQHIEERTVELGKYIVEKKCTVREAAKKFGISKSTVHKDVTQRLRKINLMLANQVGSVLLENRKIQTYKRNRMIKTAFSAVFYI